MKKRGATNKSVTRKSRFRELEETTNRVNEMCSSLLAFDESDEDSEIPPPAREAGGISKQLADPSRNSKIVNKAEDGKMTTKDIGESKSFFSRTFGEEKNSSAVSHLLQTSSLDISATALAGGSLPDINKKDEADLKIVFDLFADNVEFISVHNLEKALRFLQFKIRDVNQLVEMNTNLFENSNNSNNTNNNTNNNNSNNSVANSDFNRGNGNKNVNDFRETGYKNYKSVQDNSAVDYKPSRKLDFAAFCSCVVTLGSEWRDVRQEITRGFHKLDCEAKGRVTRQNLKHLNRKHGLGLTREEIEEMIAEMDMDGDGEIILDEFVTYMKQSHIFS